MTFNFKNILPKSADNNFKGHKLALWGFILFLVIMSWRAIIHMLFEQYGYHNIASFLEISADPDPMPIIYRFFSLWGFAQLIFCLICWVIVFKYRSLIPLMCLFWMFEWGFRVLGYPLIREEIDIQGIYTSGVTPGISYAFLPALIAIILFGLSILDKK